MRKSFGRDKRRRSIRYSIHQRLLTQRESNNEQTNTTAGNNSNRSSSSDRDDSNDMDLDSTHRHPLSFRRSIMHSFGLFEKEEDEQVSYNEEEKKKQQQNEMQEYDEQYSLDYDETTRKSSIYVLPKTKFDKAPKIQTLERPLCCIILPRYVQYIYGFHCEEEHHVHFFLKVLSCLKNVI